MPSIRPPTLALAVLTTNCFKLLTPKGYCRIVLPMNREISNFIVGKISLTGFSEHFVTHGL